MTSLSTVTFHNHELITAQHNNKPYVAMKPIVEAIGLDWDAQRKRIRRHSILSTSAVIMTVQLPNDQQRREVSFLPLSMLNGWLFGVDSNRVKPEIRETLLTYQRECFDVLNDYWNKGAAINPRKTLTPEMQRHIQELVTGIKVRKGIHWAATYNKVKNEFQVGSYKDIRIEDYPALCRFLGGEPLEGEWVGKSYAGKPKTVEVNAMSLNALVGNALGACKLMKSIYPALRTLNSPMAPSLYSRTEELHLCALLLRRELVKQPLLTQI